MLSSMTLNRILTAAMLFFASSFCIFAIQSADALMYFAIARDMFSKGIWDGADPYLYSLQNAQLHWSHQYLSILTFDWLHKSGGIAALILFKTLLWAIGLLFILRSRPHEKNPSLVWVGLFCLAVIAASFRFIERGSLFSDIFTLILIFVLSENTKVSRRLLISLAVLFWTWSQFHAGFPIGWALIGIWVFTRVLEDKNRLKPSLLWLLLLIPIVCLHPMGLQALTYPLAFSGSEAVAFRQFNFEWFPSYSREFRRAPEIISFFILIGCSFALMLLNRTRDLWHWALALFCTAAGMYYVRFVPWAAFGLVVAVKSYAQMPKMTLDRRWAQTFVTIALIAIGTKNILFGYQSSSGFRKPSLSFDARFFPLKTYAFWRQNRIPGNLFVLHDFGNYVAWQQGGEVFHHGFVTDMDFYVNDVVAVYKSQQRFLELAEKYNWTMLLIDKNNSYSRFHQWLSPLPEWRIVAEDEASYLIYKFPTP